MRQFFFLLLLTGWSASAQVNIQVSSTEVDNILRGNYNAADYAAPFEVSDHQFIICNINSEVSVDSLAADLAVLASFQNRNTYSDTLSETFGIGAATSWVYDKFQAISANNSNSLRPAYMSWEQPGGLCDTWIGDGPFKNTFAVLPGSDPDNNELVIIAAHMDSRCDDVCDIDCLAEGMEDNASGTALVLELARVMAPFSFRQTIVFLVTSGEEQGLYGANSFADYCNAEDIPIRQVQNNDIVGGIICGETSSPPSCTEPGSIDSMTVRIFANTSPLQEHLNFSRYVEYIYHEKLETLMQVPMTIAVQSQEDRTGRGVDHIPFRENGFTAVRYTSANEHGDGSPDATYTDRQHTSDDVLGVDTDGDAIIDSFFVSFTYLQRNTIINGTMAALGALAPPVPEWELIDDPAGLIVHITAPQEDVSHRVAVRTGSSFLWENVYRTDTTWFIVPGQEAGTMYFVSVAAVNEEGITGLFSREFFKTSDASTDSAPVDDLAFTFNCDGSSINNIQNINNIEFSIYPNPSSGSAVFSLYWPADLPAATATLWITDSRGNMVDKETWTLTAGQQERTYSGNLPAGMYNCTLLSADKVVAVKRWIVQ